MRPFSTLKASIWFEVLRVGRAKSYTLLITSNPTTVCGKTLTGVCTNESSSYRAGSESIRVSVGRSRSSKSTDSRTCVCANHA